MRRLAFLAAASLALIAISEPPSAEANGKRKCESGCYDKIAKKYGKRWSYGDLSPADQRSFLKCSEKCEATDYFAPKSNSMQGKFRTKKECQASERCERGCETCGDGSYVCSPLHGGMNTCKYGGW